MPHCNDNTSVDTGFDGLDYSYEDNHAYPLDIRVRGEKHLWCAVIAQAFSDLNFVHESAEAKRWLLRDNQDFMLVCALAGVSAVEVRKSALRVCELQLSANNPKAVKTNLPAASVI